LGTFGTGKVKIGVICELVESLWGQTGGRGGTGNGN